MRVGLLVVGGILCLKGLVQGVLCDNVGRSVININSMRQVFRQVDYKEITLNPVEKTGHNQTCHLLLF